MPSASVTNLFSTVVHTASPTNASVVNLFGTVVHEALPINASVINLYSSVTHDGPVFMVQDITGTIGITASFDASVQNLSSSYASYQWSWQSVPSGSTLSNSLFELPNNASPYPMSGNVGLWHFNLENITTSQVGSVGLVDSFGDGWHGSNWVSVVVNSVAVISSASLASGGGPEWYNYTANDGDSVEIIFTSLGSGSPHWGSECSYILNDAPGGAGTDFHTSTAFPTTPYSFTASGFATSSLSSSPDSSGENNDATPEGASLVSSSYLGSHCYEFDGSNDYVVLETSPSDIGIGAGNSRTISFWASASAWSNDTAMFSMGVNSSAQDFTLLQKTPSNMQLNLWGGDLYVTANSTTGWNHYFVIYDAENTTSYVYQNNELLGSIDRTLNTSDASFIRLGNANHTWSSNFFSGKIDEFAIWNRALSQCERNDVYFLQESPASAASGSSFNLQEQFSFVPDVTGSYIIGLSIFDRNNSCASISGFVTASISPATPPDCAGVIGGSAYTNSCGICVGGTTGLPADYGQYICWDGSTICTASSGGVPTGSCPPLPPDCAGTPGGSAYINSCGFCVGGTTGLPADYGQTVCWDGSIVCSASSGGVPTGSCPPESPIISGSSGDRLVTSKYGLQYAKGASNQRNRRVQQVPFSISSKSFLSIRKSSDSDFDES